MFSQNYSVYVCFLETATRCTLRYTALIRDAAQIHSQVNVVVVQDSAFRFLTSHLCRQIQKFACALFKYLTNSINLLSLYKTSKATQVG